MDPDENVVASDEITTEEVSESAPASEESRADIVLNMESMIRSHMSSIAQLKQEAEKNQGLLDGIFDNDPTYQKHCEAAKEASRIKSATKQQILKQPQAAELFEKVKNLKAELKDMQVALSDYLREYQRLSGLNQIEDDEGEVHEIVYTAKLIKKSSKFEDMR